MRAGFFIAGVISGVVAGACGIPMWQWGAITTPLMFVMGLHLAAREDECPE